jgi:prepilin-type N-terminal cleavage/methylation domain-containing protein
MNKIFSLHTPPVSKRRDTAGFTLVEMAIVIVIIGLLIGSIIVARSLIRSSELQTVLRDVNKYEAAVQNFQTKYRQLPGDFDRATALWGAADANPANCITARSSGTTQTCNGNNDGQIFNIMTGTNAYESFRAWQHLANEGLIQGGFSGVSYTNGSGSDYYMFVGDNIPQSSVPRAGFSLFFLGGQDGSVSVIFPGNYGHVLLLGGNNPPHQADYAVLTPREAQMLDTKADDGKPGSGIILPEVTSCVTTTDPTTAAYAITTSDILCSLFFVTGF